MKTKILIIITLNWFTINQICSQNLIPNSGFEDWVWTGGPPTMYENPVDWTTSNGQLLIPVEKDTIAYQGNYAIRIGILKGFEWTPGFAQTYLPILALPYRLTAFVKCTVMSGDTVYINTYCYASDTIIATGKWFSTTSIPNYTIINIPLDNQNYYTVDSAKIELISGCCPTLGGAQDGTELIVDGLNFDFSSEIEKLESKQTTIAFPNPTSNFVTIEFENSKKIKHNLTLYNTTGQIVRQIGNISTGQIRIEKQNLDNGLYFFQLLNAKKIVGNGKLIIE